MTPSTRCAAAVLLWATCNAGADGGPRDLTWPDLAAVPTAECAAVIEARRGPEAPCPPPPYDLAYLRCGLATPPLEGVRARIAGYVQPLDFEFHGIRAFLLTPPLGACRHPSPPPANQVIHVDAPMGHDVTADPIYITGVLRVETTKGDIAIARWRLEAERIEPALIPDVVAD